MLYEVITVALEIPVELMRLLSLAEFIVFQRKVIKPDCPVALCGNLLKGVLKHTEFVGRRGQAFFFEQLLCFEDGRHVGIRKGYHAIGSEAKCPVNGFP